MIISLNSSYTFNPASAQSHNHTSHIILNILGYGLICKYPRDLLIVLVVLPLLPNPRVDSVDYLLTRGLVEEPIGAHHDESVCERVHLEHPDLRHACNVVSLVHLPVQGDSLELEVTESTSDRETIHHTPTRDHTSVLPDTLDFVFSSLKKIRIGCYGFMVIGEVDSSITSGKDSSRVTYVCSVDAIAEYQNYTGSCTTLLGHLC